MGLPRGRRLSEPDCPRMNMEPSRKRRTPPSERARNDLVRLLSNGVGRNDNIVSEFVKVVARAVVQQLLEAEQADFLGGRGRYARRGARQRGSRNGYEPTSLRTEEGTIKVLVPQVRNLGEPYRSHLMSSIHDDLEMLDRTVLDAYAPWLSISSGSDAVHFEPGVLPVSRSSAAQVIGQFAADHQEFMDRDLSVVTVEHLFCDVAFESAKAGRSDGVMLIAWAIDSVGRKHLLHFAIDDKTSAMAWTSLLRALIVRSMRMPKTVTTNGTDGLIDAIASVFPRTVRVRHWFDRPTERKVGIA